MIPPGYTFMMLIVMPNISFTIPTPEKPVNILKNMAKQILNLAGIDDCHKLARIVEIAANLSGNLYQDSRKQNFMDLLAQVLTEFTEASRLGIAEGAAGIGSEDTVGGFGSEGFSSQFYEQPAGGVPSNQVRHFIGGLVAGYVFGAEEGLNIMNGREDPNDPVHGVPDINLNGKSVWMGAQIASEPNGGALPSVNGLSKWIKKNICGDH